MPKLPSKAASAATKAAQGSSREPLETGTYECRLTKVEAKNASTGNPMWVWHLEVLDDPYAGRKLWVNTTLTEAAMWKVGQMFEAFGYSTDTDTDEIIGSTCMVEVVKKIIESGAKAGLPGNDVGNCYPVGGGTGDESKEPAAVGAGASEETSEGGGPGW